MRISFTERSERKRTVRTRPLTFFMQNDIYYFYILQCCDNTRYYGHTNDLAERINKHENGCTPSTRNKGPLRLIYFEEFSSRVDAYRRERQFKNGRTRKKSIEKIIASFPQEKCQGFNSPKRLMFTAFHKPRAH